MKTIWIALLAAALAACSSPFPSKSNSGDPATPKAPDGSIPSPRDENVIVLFDGTSLANWKKTEFGGEGEVTVENGQLVLEMGAELTGVTWTGSALPRTNYEVTLEAMKIAGSDFFCGIGFPVGDATASFVAGGWGGGVCGISSINSAPASENETTTIHSFEKNRWYRFRLRVTPDRIGVWLDEEKIVDVEVRDRRFSIHPAMQLSLPFGLTSYITTAAYRNVKLRRLDGEDNSPGAPSPPTKPSP